MSISKWIMKQYWRVGTIRALMSLALGMLVLGKYYYVYIPVLSDLDFWGAITLGIALTSIFMGLGWFYDEKARLWNESVVVGLERNPYSYVPEFRVYACDYPAIYAIMATLRSLLRREDLDANRLDSLAEYLDGFFHTRPGSRTDLFTAEKRAEEFLEQNPFIGLDKGHSERKFGFMTRIKRGFQVWMLRLSYIQSLTGLGQDVLVFAAVYVVVIFPSVATDQLVPVQYLLQGILFMSVPIFVVMVLAGWFYDRKLKLWSPDLTVQLERNPYSYVPEPRTYALTYPMFYTLLKFMHDLLEHLDTATPEIRRIADYLSEFLKLQVSRQEDIWISIEKRRELGTIFEYDNEEEF
jgi:hypothetical protein